MKTRTKYIEPEIELIRLDREISLQLASDTDPYGEPNSPEWSYNNSATISNDPLKEFNA